MTARTSFYEWQVERIVDKMKVKASLRLWQFALVLIFEVWLRNEKMTKSLDLNAFRLKVTKNLKIEPLWGNLSKTGVKCLHNYTKIFNIFDICWQGNRQTRQKRINSWPSSVLSKDLTWNDLRRFLLSGKTKIKEILRNPGEITHIHNVDSRLWCTRLTESW